MSNLTVLNKPARAKKPRPPGLAAQPLCASEFDHAGLVDCIDDAMDAISVRLSLLRRNDQNVWEDSPWTWKQLTRIERRLETLQVAFMSVRKRSR